MTSTRSSKQYACKSLQAIVREYGGTNEEFIYEFAL